MTALLQRWEGLATTPRAALWALAALALIAAAYATPGLGGVLDRWAPLGIVVSGVLIGTVTALLAMGLILIYRTSRFINFAYGAMGSFAGVIAIGLHLERGVNFFLALPIGVLIGIAVGLAVDRVVRRFASTSRLILTVASIGIAQILAVAELLVASRLIGFVSITGGFEIPLGVRVPLPAKTLTGDEILIMLAVPPVLGALAWFLLRTDVGVGVRAAAENTDRALLLGIPIKRLTTVVWMVAGGLAALTFVLRAPFTGVTPGAVAGGAVVLLPALAAAVVARMESLPTAFGAGVGLGVVEQLVRWNTSGTPTLHYMVFLAVILVALLAQRGRLSRAQEGAGSNWSATGVLRPIPDELARLPEIRWARRALLGAAAVAFVLVPAGWSASNQFLAALAVVWAIAAVSLVVLTGWGGHMSLGQFALVGVGGLTTANLISRFNLDLFAALAASGAAGALAALLVGLPALRIRGPFLAVTTLAFAVALDNYVINPQNFGWLIPGSIQRPVLWERFDLEDNYTMYVFCLAFLALAILAAHGMRKARAGRVIIATRDNQRAADAASVPTNSVKLTAFVVAGTIAGVAGGLHVLLVRQLVAGTYPAYDSLNLFATAVIGGLGSITGALMGVLLFQYLGTVAALGDIRPFLTGAVLLIVLLALPGGLGQLAYAARDALVRRVAVRRGILAPTLLADRREGGDDLRGDESGLLSNALGGPAAAPSEAAARPGSRPAPAAVGAPASLRAGAAR